MLLRSREGFGRFFFRSVVGLWNRIRGTDDLSLNRSHLSELVEELLLGPFDTNSSTQFKLAGTIIFLRTTSFQDHRHKLIGFLDCSLSGDILEVVGACLFSILPVLLEVSVRIAPTTEEA